VRPGAARIAVDAARLLVGGRLLVGALALALTESGRQEFARHGLPDTLRLVLSGAEALASVLFMLPISSSRGAPPLLLVLAAAMALHVAVGESPVPLIAWASAVLPLLRGAEALRGIAGQGRALPRDRHRGLPAAHPGAAAAGGRGRGLR
jgi:hypothetical protein